MPTVPKPFRVVTFSENGAVTAGVKVPHIGWNAVHARGHPRILRGVHDGAYVYFVHSYFARPADSTIIAATTDHGVEFCCAVERGNIAATQFHPEKSGAVGLQILRNFVVWDGVC